MRLDVSTRGPVSMKKIFNFSAQIMQMALFFVLFIFW
jgi:hypothetical protein